MKRSGGDSRSEGMEATHGSVHDARGEGASTSQGAESSEEIRRRAYDLYLARGEDGGGEMDDWLRAESEVRGRSAGDAERSLEGDRNDGELADGRARDDSATEAAADVGPRSSTPAPRRSRPRRAPGKDEARAD